jgi:thiamine-monophosphate kinase
VPKSDEFSLIRLWNAGRQSPERLAALGVVAGIGDDAAIVTSPNGHQWLLAMDTMAENIHFRPETMGDADIGYKALAANISDIAAMGGIPRYALVSVSVPPSWDPQRITAVFDGLYACAEQYDVAIVGGDTTSAEQHMVLAVALAGTVPAGQAVRRSGAQAGDFVFVTGPVGLSAGGLFGLLNHGRSRNRTVPPPPERLVRAHQRPRPSVEAGRLLAERGWATSLNDISDGLASECWEIAEASGLRVVLREAALPLSGELASYASDCMLDPLEWMLYGGEDYVLLGTAAQENEPVIKEAFRSRGLPFFVVGHTEDGPPSVELITPVGRRKKLEKRGYNHFMKG